MLKSHIVLLSESSSDSLKDGSGPSKSSAAPDQIQLPLLPRSTVERMLREFGLPVSICNKFTSELHVGCFH